MSSALNLDAMNEWSPATMVRAAQKSLDLDRLYGRLVGMITHYPPSSVVLDRFVCVDPDLHAMVVDTAKVFIQEDPRNPITTTEQCIEALGATRVAEMTMIILIDQVFSEVFRGSGYLSREMTKHAVGVATLMKFLCERHEENPDRAWLFGICFRLGIPIMGQAAPEAYARCFSRLPGSQIQLHNAEKAVFGFDHRDVLHEMAKAYHFPEWFVEASDPDGLPIFLKACAPISSHITHKLGYDMGLATGSNHLRPRHIEIAKIDSDELSTVRTLVLEAVQEVQRYAI
jgi:hypothetical protein